MSYQVPSVYYANGHPHRHAIVASVHFPTNRTALDGQDLAILDEVVQRYRMVLLGRRVTLRAIGYADHRGASRRNRSLGLGRARAVLRYLDAALGGARFYSSYPALSQGEDQAVQGTTDRRVLALDRRVDVYSSWVHRRIQITEPMLIRGTVPRLRRITHRTFSKISPRNLAGRPDPSAEAFREGTSGLIAIMGGEQAVFENTWGSEEASSRRTQEYPASHRVNVVRMEKDYDLESTGMAEISSWRAGITYEWGPPQPQVIVHETIVALGSPSRHTRAVPRAEADQSPILNPPDP